MQAAHRRFDMPVLTREIPASLKPFFIELGRRIQLAIQDPPTQTEPGARVKTDDTVITPELNGERFSNYGSTGPITFQLPSAIPGLEYEFTVDTDNDVYIAPASGERHLLGSANDAIKITDVGDLIRIGCSVTGIWRIIRVVGCSTLSYFSYIPDAYGLPIPSADGSPIPGA